MPTVNVEDATPEERAHHADLEAKARQIARSLERFANPDGKREVGFALLLFRFGDPPQPSTYISNGDRADMIGAIEEWLQRAKART